MWHPVAPKPLKPAFSFKEIVSIELFVAEFEEKPTAQSGKPPNWAKQPRSSKLTKAMVLNETSERRMACQ
jgi:hypothetical protein